jgi:hypothetical protein
MTNPEMQDRTTADVIGKAAGRDQHHSVGFCDVADLADRCLSCLVRMAWPLPRRLAKDFEATIASAVAWALVAHIRTLTRRLARA